MIVIAVRKHVHCSLTRAEGALIVGATSRASIRASVDALCRDGAGEISRDRLQSGRLTRQGMTS